MKNIKTSKPAHTSKTQHGSGDFVGRAIPNKMGRIISVYGEDDVNPKPSKMTRHSLA